MQRDPIPTHLVVFHVALEQNGNSVHQVSFFHHLHDCCLIVLICLGISNTRSPRTSNKKRLELWIPKRPKEFHGGIFLHIDQAEKKESALPGDVNEQGTGFWAGELMQYQSTSLAKALYETRHSFVVRFVPILLIAKRQKFLFMAVNTGS